MKKCAVVIAVFSSLLLSSVGAWQSWTSATPAAAFGPRNCIGWAVFHDQLWVLGGESTSAVPYNDVWSSYDGVNWTQVTSSAGWSKRFRLQVAVLRDTLWVIGGGTSSANYNDVWASADGASWVQVTASSPWAGRKGHSSVVYHDKLWIFGGSVGPNTKHDVWSSPDGINWTLVDSAAPWATRGGQATVVWRDTIWLLSGCPGGTNYKNDVWFTTDGDSWTARTTTAPWVGRRGLAALVLHDTLWMMGGNNDTTYFDDVWYTVNGADWFQATTHAGWHKRWNFGYGVLNDELWLYAGWTTSSPLVTFNDVWHTVSRRLAAGWNSVTPIPNGPKNKATKDGGALAYGKENTGNNDSGYVYAFKGNNTYEFYRYGTLSNTWAARESIPARDRLNKKKGLKKGASLVVGTDRRVYATKGNNTRDFFRYDPAAHAWTQLADVPAGTKACKEGTSLAAVNQDGTDYVYLLKGSGTNEFYRYDVANDLWDATLPSAPSGTSGKPYKSGSSITYDGTDLVYALKGSYNEFFAYSVSNRTWWQTYDPLPLVAPPGTRKTKAKDGAQIAYGNRMVYALKGGNTNEFWAYNCDAPGWSRVADLPTGLKRVKSGGALTYASDLKVLYAFRGNGTWEFWAYNPGGMFFASKPAGGGVTGAGLQDVAGYGFAVAPNPFASRAQVSYILPRPGRVSLKLYDVTGALVTTLAQGNTPAGSYRVTLDADKLARGVYVLKFESGDYRTTRKVTIE